MAVLPPRPVGRQVARRVVGEAGIGDAVLVIERSAHRGPAALRGSDARQVAVGAVAPRWIGAAIQAVKGIGKAARFENRILRYAQQFGPEVAWLSARCDVKKPASQALSRFTTRVGSSRSRKPEGLGQAAQETLHQRSGIACLSAASTRCASMPEPFNFWLISSSECLSMAISTCSGVRIGRSLDAPAA